MSVVPPSPTILFLYGSPRADRTLAAGLRDDFTVVETDDQDEALRLAAGPHAASLQGVVLAVGSGIEEAAAFCTALRGVQPGAAVIAVIEGWDAASHESLLSAGATVCLPGNARPGVVSAQLQALRRPPAEEGARAARVLQSITEALRESEERLRLAVDSTGLGTFDLDPRSGRLLWSALAKRHFGLSASADVTFDTFVRGLHPDDRDRVLALVERVQRPDSGGKYKTEYRTIGLEDGVERWLSAEGRVFFGDTGRPVRFIGVTVDITERKRAEQALQEALREAEDGRGTLQALMEHIPLGITIADAPDVRVRAVSRFGRELAGRMPEEIEGIPVQLHVERWPVFRADGVTPATNEELPLTRATVGGEIVREEEWVIGRPDGRRVPILCTAAPIRDGHGRVRGGVLGWQDITERKRAEVALREREVQLRAAAMAAEIGIWHWTPGSNALSVRANWRRLFGLSPDEEVTFETWRKALHPEDRDRTVRELQSAAAGAGDFTAEYRVVWPDGSVHWLIDRGRASYDEQRRTVHMAGINVDITERKRAEEELHWSAAILAQAGKMASLGAWDVTLSALDDLNANVLHWSEETYRIFGYEPGQVEVTNDLFFERVHPDDRARVADAMREAMAEGRPYSVEHRIVRPDGSERIVYEHAEFTFDADGRPWRITGAVQDVTARRQAEEAVRAANARLEEADRRKDEFIAMLSHELRNPLAPIRFALPLLEGERLSKNGAKALAAIDRQLHQLTRLVDDLLDVSRVTRGKIELRRDEIALGAVVTTAAEAASPAIQAGRHTLNLDVPEQPIWVHADAGRLAQVVANLLNNSAKFTPRGGTISVTARQDGADAVVRVRDTGIGIPTHQLSTVFEMFRQVHGQGRSQGGGLGIGLALAKQLVELHGGTIEARSDGPGLGSEFVIRLPLASPGRTAVPASGEEATASPPVAAGARLRVLVVDDNVDLVEMLATLVTSLGHDVRTAVDGRSAISAALSYRPHVVLLDLGLPLVSGIDVARELRRHAALAETRLVALTGWGQPDDRQQTREAGFDFHLTKPADASALTRLLAEFATSLR